MDPADHLVERDAGQVVVALPVGHLVGGTGVRHLEVAEFVALVGGEQAVAVDAPEAGGGLVGREPFGDEGVPELVGDADTGAARAEDDDPVVAQGQVTGLGAGEDGGEVDCAGALDVVVEGEDVVAVVVEDAAGVGGSEVLPVQQSAGNSFVAAVT
ncbi:hypothetical protein SAV14893_032520 [Streptomyces avermitilis]|uniref:Uncharacterized protein n=1 Tax=Streptomyces avermitilis TaxID=33903 RepID=A0A4D4LZY0_STRAX|nr:hypothetical protein SAV14893_032520 [Streptomyces avermitilis]